MVKITVDNSTCSIQGLNIEQFAIVRNALSYTEQSGANKYSRFGMVKKFLISKRGEYPTGLTYLVIETLRQHKIPYSVEDRRIRPILNKKAYKTLFVKSGPTPYPEQTDAAKAILAQIGLDYGRGIVVAPTGLGKSYIIALICENLKVPTLIVVPSLELKKQLTISLKELFGADKVGHLDSKGQPIKLISVENVDNKVLKNPPKSIEALIIDEFHHSGTLTMRNLNKKAWNHVFFRIGITATAFRSNENERLLLESVLSKVVYKIEYKTAVEKGYIAPLEAYFIELPRIAMKGNAKNYQSVYAELVVNRKDRHEIVANLAHALDSQGLSTLVLLKQIEHGEQIQQILSDKNCHIAFVKGDNEDNREKLLEFNLRERNTLIGTSVISEGVDTKPAEYIILAGGGKSKIAFMQALGRGFRKYPGKDSCKVILIKDQSHKWLAEHYALCVEYLKEEYGILPSRLEI